MKMENLDEVFRTLFGVDVLQIYLEVCFIAFDN